MMYFHHNVQINSGFNSKSHSALNKLSERIFYTYIGVEYGEINRETLQGRCSYHRGNVQGVMFYKIVGNPEDLHCKISSKKMMIFATSVLQIMGEIGDGD